MFAPLTGIENELHLIALTGTNNWILYLKLEYIITLRTAKLLWYKLKSSNVYFERLYIACYSHAGAVFFLSFYKLFFLNLSFFAYCLFFDLFHFNFISSFVLFLLFVCLYFSLVFFFLFVLFCFACLIVWFSLVCWFLLLFLFYFYYTGCGVYLAKQCEC